MVVCRSTYGTLELSAANVSRIQKPGSDDAYVRMALLV